jgi:DNA polymerase III, alpha subunit (EC 2.7.7.7)
MKLRLDAPDVNFSDFKFTVNNDGRIVYGLGAIKGVGEGPVEAIVEARAQGGRSRTCSTSASASTSSGSTSVPSMR